jgi:hypothetical protein
MTAKRKFPTLYKKIIDNFEQYQDETMQKKSRMLETKINEALNAQPPISLIEFSRLTDISFSTIKRYSPDLCDALVQRYKQYKAQLKEDKIRIISEEIETLMIKLQEKDIYPSIKQIQKEISNPNVFLKEIYRNIWKEKMLKFGFIV